MIRFVLLKCFGSVRSGVIVMCVESGDGRKHASDACTPRGKNAIEQTMESG